MRFLLTAWLLLLSVPCFGQELVEGVRWPFPTAAAGGDNSVSGPPGFVRAQHTNGTSVSSRTISNFQADGFNTGILVGVFTYNSGVTISSVKWNDASGPAFTHIATTNAYDTNGKLWLFHKAGLAGTSNIIVTASGTAAEMTAMALLVTNNHQSASYGTPVMDFKDANVTGITNTATTTTIELAVDAFFAGSGSLTYTAGTDQTERIVSNIGAGAGITKMSTKAAGSPTTTMYWNPFSSPEHASQIVIGLKGFP